MAPTTLITNLSLGLNYGLEIRIVTKRTLNARSVYNSLKALFTYLFRFNVKFTIPPAYL
jgi:hypothetical protein